MSKTLWWVVAVVAIVVVAGALWYSWGGSSQGSSTGTGYSYVGNQEAATASATSATLPSSGTSNAALQADLSAIDSQMNGFSSDNSNMNSSLSDQEVAQSSL